MSLSKESLSKKQETLEKASGWAMVLGVILAPILGFGLVILVLKLSLIIKLFHKMVFFNTSFGSYLNYVLVATSKFIKGSEEQSAKPPSFVARFENKRLIDDGNLNEYSTSALKFWLPFLLGFFLLRLIRIIFRTFIFAAWEEKHGTGFYNQYDQIYSPNKKVRMLNGITDEAQKLKEDEDEKIGGQTKAELKPVEREEYGFQLNCWHKFLLKIYSLTIMLEFVLLCNMMGENIFLHLLFNSAAVSFSKNQMTAPFITNFLLSLAGFLIFSYEMCRFIKICTEFLRGQLKKKYKVIRTLKFEKLSKLFKFFSNKDEMSAADVKLD